MPEAHHPPLSIVVPSHDTRELTLRCLASLGGSPPGTEVVLVDDGSADGTAAEVAARFPAVRVLRNDRALGFTRAANRGLGVASGEVLLLLNSDTEVDAAGLPALLAAFAEDPRLGAAGAALRYPDGRPQWSGGRAPSLLWLFALSSGLPVLLARLPLYRRARPLAAGGDVDWVTGAAMALRRAAWEAAGPMDEGFRFYAQDLDLCLRLRAAGWRVAVLPGFAVLHHHGATIGREAGASGPRHPELLWSDLVRWAGKRSERWGTRAALVLRAGTALRLSGRWLAYPFLPAGRREGWRAEDRAYARALAALRRSAGPPGRK
jgi:N-acetylglucosaminyl-diphospho-decaprenol L-rhamnosyltransferase